MHVVCFGSWHGVFVCLNFMCRELRCNAPLHFPPLPSPSLSFPLLLKGHHVFSADSKADMNEWIQCIREAIDEDKLKSRRGVKSMYSKGSQSSAGSVEEGSAGDGSNQRDPTHAITSGESLSLSPTTALDQ